MWDKSHWEKVYSTKPSNQVSWFQERATHSLKLIHKTGVSKDASIIDVGGGASVLVDELLAEQYSDISVLDLSAEALITAQNRLGNDATQVKWIEADITEVCLPLQKFDVWHDRAVFHFLTEPEHRRAYVERVIDSVKPGGHVIVATFAEDGPTQCSGLPIVRYRAEELHAEFGKPFTLIAHEKEAHNTPFGTVQQFVYCYCRLIGTQETVKV